MRRLQMLVAVAMTVVIGSEAAATRYYVDATASGSNTGLSWDDAFVDLNLALATADRSDTVWVAASTYHPHTADRTLSFQIPPHVVVLGGFSGTEDSESLRDPVTNVTVLSGEIGAATVLDNSYHVVVCSTSTILDGFTLSGGYGNGSYTDLTTYGAGALVAGDSVRFHAVRFIGNVTDPAGLSSGGGAGLFVETSYDFTTVEDCEFEDNHANGPNGRGGGVWFASANNDVIRCTFRSNTTGNDAGAVRNPRRISDCYFEGNVSQGQAGAVFAPDTITNTVFVNNQAEYSGGAVVGGAFMANCDFMGNRGGAGGAARFLGRAENCRFIGNVSSGPAGAISPGGSVGGFSGSYENCVFVGNYAATCGGVVESYGPIFTGCTIVGNSAGVEVGGLCTWGSACRNTIIWGNRAPSEPNVREQSNLEFTNCILEGSGGSGLGWNGALGIDGGGNLDMDPLLVDTGQGDARIGGLSPARDAGSEMFATLEVDAGGAPRVAGAAIDIGAFEAQCENGPVVYVDGSATGGATGNSWIDAYVTVREGVILPCEGVSEVWVAAGVYTPSPDSSLSVPMRNGVAIYGGFGGTESQLGDRDWVAHTTIFSGGIGAPGPEDNSEHVVSATGCDSTAVLDGIVIAGGRADRAGTPEHTRGGGVLVVGGNPLLRNVVFRDNFGWTGAAIAVQDGGRPTFVNPIAYDNVSLYRGGFLFAIESSPAVVNGTIVANTSPYGGALSALGGGATTVVNTIVWGNGLALEHTTSPYDVSHSLIQGCGGSGAGWNAAFGSDGGGNIDDDPLCVDVMGRDLHLMSGSPAIDAGDNTANPLTVDAEGSDRIVGDIDIGAYETGLATAISQVTPADGLRAFPNPFNPSVTLTFAPGAPGDAELLVTDVAGRLVCTLYRGRAAGPVSVTWDGRDDSGARVASGVYFAVLRAAGVRETRKLVVIK